MKRRTITLLIVSRAGKGEKVLSRCVNCFGNRAFVVKTATSSPQAASVSDSPRFWTWFPPTDG
jgi:hypothetical protein